MKIKNNYFAIALIAAGLLSGCATERVMTTGATAPRTNAASVKIYLTEKPAGHYEELGRVSVDKYNNFGITRSTDELNAMLKEKAASIGGDAIIGTTEDFACISGVVIKFTKRSDG